ncbi:MAG: hypothetical protein WAW03_17500 [Anaerolineae bacterium]|uniref:hypothetical protein n=1 Tax=Candidatus Amarolinea dominans TaxID=3140696 RepID=UPI001DE9563C|nr:hypothetical protein [Anaerolineae bacterium]MBK7204310.1 hypothetical protein [Anaerolineae bacterium]MBK9233016.1 hypothetical protein [Anaerolineae bacterium]
MPNYDELKFPPAPVLELRISCPDSSPSSASVLALIDTGSDFSLAPERWLIEIGAPALRAASARGLWSDYRSVMLYLVDLHLDQGVLANIEVVGFSGDDPEDDQEMILGRNVLNKLIVLLDGPRLRSEVLQRRPLKF